VRWAEGTKIDGKRGVPLAKLEENIENHENRVADNENEDGFRFLQFLKKLNFMEPCQMAWLIVLNFPKVFALKLIKMCLVP